jgi:hypothetical protein
MISIIWKVCHTGFVSTIENITVNEIVESQTIHLENV